MSRGSYLGGSSIISAASLWRDQAQRDREVLGEKSDVRWAGRPRKPKTVEAEQAKTKPITAKSKKKPPRAKQIRANNLEPSHGKLTAAMRERAAMLKAQVAEGILLPTGKPNPNHPANRKDAKK